MDRPKKFRSYGSLVSLLLIIAGVAYGPPAAAGAGRPGPQEIGQPLQYERKVILKLLQVSVLDKKGQPVRDLTKEDFIVYDNGRPVEITDFERHSLRPPGGESERKTAVAEAAAKADETPPVLNRKFIFLFDFAFNNPRGIGKAKEAALDFLDTKVGPDDEAAVLTYSMVRGLRVQEYLTNDHRKAREVIESIDRKASSGRASEIEEQYWREATEGLPAVRESTAGEGRPTSSNSSWQRQEAKNIAQVFIERLTDLAKALRYIQGRKDFLFFSSGVPTSMIYGAQAGSAAGGRNRFDPGDSVLRERNEAMLREFSASDCAFYAFDTREAAKVASLFTYDEQTFLSGHRDLFSTQGVFADYNSVFKDEQLTGRDSLQRLSRTTGGKYFGNIDSYDKSHDQVQDLTATYYVLGYPILEKEDGSFHEVRVDVRRKGCEVHGASGYFNPKPFREFNELERKLHLFDLAMNERAFSRIPEGFAMKVAGIAFSGRSGLLQLGRMPKDLTAKLAGGPLEFVSLVLDGEDSLVDMQRVEINGSPPGSVLFESRTPVGEGTYTCRLVVRNLVTGAAAVSSVARTEIGPGTEGLRILPLMLFTKRDGPVARLVARGSRSAGPFPQPEIYPLDSDELVPVLDGLEPGRELAVVAPCEAGFDAAEDLIVSARLIDARSGERVPVSFFLKGRTRLGPVQIIQLRIPAGSLEAGGYLLYVYIQGPASGETAYGRIALSVLGD